MQGESINLVKDWARPYLIANSYVCLNTCRSIDFGSGSATNLTNPSTRKYRLQSWNILNPSRAVENRSFVDPMGVSRPKIGTTNRIIRVV
ncbi:unnamed protein product [Nesidiocoris tenuis]|uniref:Uncharacterized protein n=1 Tax=Nesidiocoris tenuis TaxID=355587 RepID=A0A6H5H3Q3_9HEMI|nr:unnamed protein product [Nesidiocoris tenuis]